MNSFQSKRSAIFDYAYAKASQLHVELNPCNPVSCGKFTICLEAQDRIKFIQNYPAPQKEKDKDILSAKKESFCCSGCPHLNKKTGCTVQSLSCKLWFCDSVRTSSMTEDMAKRLIRLIQLGVKYNLLSFRGAKAKVMKQKRLPQRYQKLLDVLSHDKDFRDHPDRPIDYRQTYYFIVRFLL